MPAFGTVMPEATVYEDSNTLCGKIEIWPSDYLRRLKNPSSRPERTRRIRKAHSVDRVPCPRMRAIVLRVPLIGT